MQVLLGADPEVFVKKGGLFTSAFNLIPGTKNAPHKVEKGAVQVDGMALEFNIDPATNEEEFLNNIQAVLASLKSMVPDYELSIVPTAEFGMEYIKAQPDKAKELGCDPDFNAYTGKANAKPDGERPFRTAAGHVHIGWTEGKNVLDYDHELMCRDLVKELDVLLGIPSVLLDSDGKRREMYGQAGCYRPKSYGVEYRVLSNFWIDNPALILWVYRSVSLAIKNLLEGTPLYKRIPEDSIQQVINASDVRESLRLCNALGLEVPHV